MYFPLIWMCQSRQVNKKINKPHERALKLIYDDYNEILQKLLQRDRTCAMHENNIQQLAIEM